MDDAGVKGSTTCKIGIVSRRLVFPLKFSERRGKQRRVPLQISAMLRILAPGWRPSSRDMRSNGSAHPGAALSARNQRAL
jgi:hypothetical protein